MRKHIAKALQARSKAIRNALGRYNSAAAALHPPRRTLSWEEIVDFTFLADFDILRDPEGNAAIREWATPAARQLMDSFFKLRRAKEEIIRLNIEIRRFVTYLQDEKAFLLKKESELMVKNPVLAFFVRRYRLRRGRFDEIHKKRFVEMKKKLGSRFTGTLIPGTRKMTATQAQATATGEVQQEDARESSGREAEDADGPDYELEGEECWVDEGGSSDEDCGEDAEGEELSKVMEGVAMLAVDKEDVGNDD